MIRRSLEFRMVGRKKWKPDAIYETMATRDADGS